MIMRSLRFRSASGFTLVELLIATAVASIIMGATVSAMISGNKNQNVAQDVVIGQQNARLALKLLERDIRGAGSQVFRVVSPCGGYVYAPVSFTEVDDYRNTSFPQRLTQDAYPLQLTFTGSQVDTITARGGGISSQSSNGHVFEVVSNSTGTNTFTINLNTSGTSPQPDPDFTPGTLLLACGGDLDATGGVLYKVVSGDFASGYVVECPSFPGGSAELEEANFIRANPMAVMDVSFLAQTVTYRIDRDNKKLEALFPGSGAFQGLLNGISDVRIMVDQGGAFTNITAADVPAVSDIGVLNLIKIEIDSQGPEDQTITSSGLVRLRNVP